jgi:precorrin-2 dehydrogenase/sirohydrochlorin ferrochelatase
MTNKDFMPISIDVRNKKILLIGGGKVALHKIESLQKYASNIVILAKEVHPEIKTAGFNFIEKAYEKPDIYDSFLVYACTNNSSLNEQIRKDCEKSGKLVNVVDNPVLCDFVSPAIFRKSNMSIAVSSNGEDVYNSIRVRNSIRQIFRHDKFLLP